MENIEQTNEHKSFINVFVVFFCRFFLAVAFFFANVNFFMRDHI